jgi:hypothetical protein
MSETPTTTIKVKSPRMLAEMIAWTQADFYPDPRTTPEPPTATAPSRELMDTVNFSKLDDDNIWTDV